MLQDAIGLWHAKPKMESAVFENQAAWIQGRVDELLRRKPRDYDNFKLCKRIRKHRESIFRFLYDPDAEPTNNLAERELRPLVINRKLSGGNRSRRGADRTALLYSVYATLHRQGQERRDGDSGRLIRPSDNSDKFGLSRPRSETVTTYPIAQ